MEKATIRKVNKVRVSILVFGFLLMAAVCSVGIYLYLNQIVNVDNIEIKARQNSRVELPATSVATLKSGKTRIVDVAWETDGVDTSQVGPKEIHGSVKKYKNPVNFKVTVYFYIQSVSDVKSVILANDKDLGLPETVYGHISTGLTENEKVEWQNTNLDTSKPGNYKVTGKVISELECDVDAQADIEVISKEEAFKRMLIANDYVNKPEVVKALNVAKTLPDKVVSKIFKYDVKIRFIPEMISDLPEYRPSSPDVKYAGLFDSGKLDILVHYEKVNPIRDYFIHNESITIAAIHEIGHAFDYERKNNKGVENSESDPEFKVIYEKEAANLFNRSYFYYVTQSYLDYFVNSKAEYFAQCFAFYFTNDASKKVLQEKAPETYKYISKLIEN